MNTKPEVRILSGPPCSGKSTYANELVKNYGWVILSRDDIREETFGKKYKQNSRDEKKVNIVFFGRLKEHIQERLNVIIDNTNCKISYINELKTWFPKDYDIKIVYFNVPLWKLYVRNVTRWIKSGKFIPFRVIKQMHVNFKKLPKCN